MHAAYSDLLILFAFSLLQYREYFCHCLHKCLMIMVKGKAVPEQAYCRPGGFQEVEAHRFQDSLHMKVVKGCQPLRNIPGTHFCLNLSRSQGHSVAGKVMSVKNSIGTIGTGTRDLPACRVVPQSTAPPRATTPFPLLSIIQGNIFATLSISVE